MTKIATISIVIDRYQSVILVRCDGVAIYTKEHSGHNEPAFDEARALAFAFADGLAIGISLGEGSAKLEDIPHHVVIDDEIPDGDDPDDRRPDKAYDKTRHPANPLPRRGRK